MNCYEHRWSRALKGRRTGLWIRTCTVCGVQTHDETKPDQADPPRVTEARVEVRPDLDVRRPMERIAVKAFGARLQLDTRMRRAGED